MKSLMRLENWIEQLVEEPFVRLFAGQLLPQEVAAHLVRALEDAERPGADGTPEVPGNYRIALNPQDLTALKADNPELEETLAEALKSLVEHMQIRLRRPPTVTLHADTGLPPRSVRILATESPPPAEPTRDLDLTTLETLLTAQESEKHNAYLIIQGKRTVDLTQPVLRIGRALDNDLIIEERNISRYHAQLRLRYGRYILEDLHSTGGTKINGFPIQEVVLRPGDIISLSGIEMVYVEEDAHSSTERGDTRPYNAPESS